MGRKIGSHNKHKRRKHPPPPRETDQTITTPKTKPSGECYY